ncbi:MAG: hypothetical protein KJO13_08420 [Gammaproteobacteria bacterium]|nr:hypothetical protein [Gammaproteobacteria bacterium]
MLLLLWACALPGAPLHAAEAAEAPATEWVTVDADGEVSVHLYFFWTATCPHCQRAKPFVEALPAKFPWLTLHSHVLDREHRDNVSLYVDMARTLGKKAGSVPAFLYCGKMFTGYDEEATTGAFLVDGLQECHDRALETGGQLEFSTQEVAPGAAAEEPGVSIPLIGEIDVEALSLPALTVVLAGLDSFNPCAFFVLLFLLSLLVHARSRQRMLIIGGTFVFFSGFIYFLFMAAWLNLFLVIGNTQWVTLTAGLVALILGLINIKDFVWFKRGVSLSIPDDAKPKLYERMRGLVAADNLAAMMVGAIALSIAANSYELLCTAGFPMVFTRALTLNDLPTSSYYLYLVLYNVIYVIPLLLIVGVFVATLGSRKLSEREGRVLKLLSGLMMFELGVVLVFAPAALNNVMTAIVLLVVALLLTLVLTRFGPKTSTA